MKKKVKLILIAVLLIAVAAVSFGIQKIYKERAAGQTADIVSEQADGVDAEESVSPEKQDGDNAGASSDLLETIFFASDYQPEDGFDDPSETLRAILEAAKADGKEINRVVMCGDYTNDPVFQNYQISPDNSIEEIREIVAAECPSVETGVSEEETADDQSSGDDILFVQGNHDALTSQISQSGLHEYDDCLIYILNTEEDFPWKQGKTMGCLAKVRRSSAEMKTCLDELIRKGETRPVFIAGHVPLHFTARTSSMHTTGDNLYSSLIFDVVNDAAESLDIVYLFGHNHSKGWDCYLGGSCVYKAKGDTILIPRFEETWVNTDEYTEEMLNFTYLNAGYTGYYMNCGTDEYFAGRIEEFRAADETLTGTVFEVYEDRIVVTRYDNDGVHVLGHKGEADPYKGGIDAGLITEESYSKEIKSPQEIKVIY